MFVVVFCFLDFSDDFPDVFRSDSMWIVQTRFCADCTFSTEICGRCPTSCLSFILSFFQSTQLFYILRLGSWTLASVYSGSADSLDRHVSQIRVPKCNAFLHSKTILQGLIPFKKKFLRRTHALNTSLILVRAFLKRWPSARVRCALRHVWLHL